MTTLTVKYFAWVRERVGHAEETVTLPDGVATVADLIAHLAARDEGYAHAFEQAAVIRAAIDRRHVPHETPLAGAREVAFFPPMTGG
jgi:sulfur-carrier protein